MRACRAAAQYLDRKIAKHGASAAGVQPAPADDENRPQVGAGGLLDEALEPSPSRLDAKTVQIASVLRAYLPSREHAQGFARDAVAGPGDDPVMPVDGQRMVVVEFALLACAGCPADHAAAIGQDPVAAFPEWCHVGELALEQPAFLRAQIEPHPWPLGFGLWLAG